MRLAKKIAAIALAAAMSVSMLTACGGGGSSTGNSNSSSSGSKPSSSSSASSGASSGSSSSSASSSSSSNASSDSSSTDESEIVDYTKSRTAKFFQKLGNNFTIDVKETVEGGDEMDANILMSTNGSRIYMKIVDDNPTIELEDMVQKKGWIVIPTQEEIFEGVKPGEYGYYAVAYTADDFDDDESALDGIEPVTGMKFTKKTQGAYYIETQTVEQGKEKDVVSYWYEGNSSMPKYIVTEVFENGQKMEVERIEFKSIEFKARAEYMDFESILSKCTDVTDLIYPKD